MDTPSICSYTMDEMHCERPAIVGTDRCDRHPHNGGYPPAVAPSPSTKPPGSAFDRVKNLLAIERLIELGSKALKWIEENIPPDIFGAADQSSLSLLRRVVGEADTTKKRELASQLVASMTPAQLLLIIALAVASSSALRGGSAGSSGDA